MDKPRAVRIFLERVERLARLPFITDAEMDGLYGDEVAAALDSLARVEQERHLCRDCAARCCPAVKCELYAPEFDRCPVYDLRPPVCRLHYCHRFFENGDTLLKDLSDVFFDGLIAAENGGSGKTGLFDAPPLGKLIPGLVQASSRWIESVKAGKMAPEEAIACIYREASQYR